MAHSGAFINVEKGDEESCRNDDQAVGFEFVAHGASLGSCGGNGGIGNEGEIIAKEGSSYDNSYHEGKGNPGFFCDADSNRSQGYDGSYRGPYGKGDKTCGDENTSHEQIVRQDEEGQVDGGVNGSHGLGRLGEGSGKDENPDHHQDVPVGRSGGEIVDFPREGHSLGDDDTPGTG